MCFRMIRIKNDDSFFTLGVIFNLGYNFITCGTAFKKDNPVILYFFASLDSSMSTPITFTSFEVPIKSRIELKYTIESPPQIPV